MRPTGTVNKSYIRAFINNSVSFQIQAVANSEEKKIELITAEDKH